MVEVLGIFIVTITIINASHKSPLAISLPAESQDISCSLKLSIVDLREYHNNSIVVTQ